MRVLGVALADRVTQTRSLPAAEATAREYLALVLDIDDEDSLDVDVVPQLGAELTRQIRAAQDQVKTAAKMQREAADKQRDVAERLHRTGLSGREIAVVLQVTPQRVSQLLSNKTALRADDAQRRPAQCG